MGIGENHAIGTRDEAGSLTLLLLDGGATPEQTTQRIDHPLGGVDPHHRRSNLLNSVNNHIAAARQRG